MGDVHYMISETAKRVGVESHVLRYWEEELNLPIGRTEMGHRHYTQEDIQLFGCIKELKEEGMQLKEIKEIIPDLLRAKAQLRAKRQSTDLPGNSGSAPVHSDDQLHTTDYVSDTADIPEVLQISPDYLQAESLLTSVIQNVILENNKILEENICKGVTEKVAKDMDFLLQAKDRQEEDRFRKLDHLIRQQQTIRKEASRPAPSRYLRKLFGES